MIIANLAEREGFEPSVPLPIRRFSRPFPSTTRTPLRSLLLIRLAYCTFLSVASQYRSITAYAGIQYSVMDSDNQNEGPKVIPPQWQYQSGQLEQATAPVSQQSPVSQEVQNDDSSLVRWTASEFVSHEKSIGWYLILGFVALLVAAILYFVTKELFSIAVVLILAVALAVFGNLKPRTLDYAILPDGIQIGDKHFGYATFRSFAVIEDGPVPSIQLLPQKRFMVPITIYFAPTDIDAITETLGDYLPFEHKERDFVDKISSRIRF